MSNTQTLANMPPHLAALPPLPLVENFTRTAICDPALHHSLHGKLRRAAGRAWLKQRGFTARGVLPDVPRCVLMCVPHTSNWDFTGMVALGGALDFYPAWVGKDTLFRPPFGAVSRWLGGIPVVRGAGQNQTAQVAEAIVRADRCVLAIAPEGTRKKASRWKSGFWHIAKHANVPISFGFLDYTHRIIGFGPLVYPGADFAADFAQIADFYAGFAGKFPSQQGAIVASLTAGEASGGEASASVAKLSATKANVAP